jgi:hypothetical protein
MKYAVEMGSGAMMYVPSFITYWFSHSNFMVGGGNSQTHRHTEAQIHRCIDTQIPGEHGDRISLISYFQNKESKLKRETRQEKKIEAEEGKREICMKQ